MTGSWRDLARPLIADDIRDVGRDDMPKLRKALRDAFPWPPRKRHPYKVWLDEINVQLGTKKRKARQQLVNDGQMELF